MTTHDETLIPFKMHPRVFAALGADLVTNDVVALIELVKNSYDAFARNVWLRFGENKDGSFIEIEDDGCGMSRKTIEEVWCLVATPFKQEHQYSDDEKQRRVSGEKGLGRLSAARLGAGLLMKTQAKGNPCWEVSVDWKGLADAKSLASCYVSCKTSSEKSPFKSTGTLINISKLSSNWDAPMLDDLKDNLARLISPFAETEDFTIHVDDGGGNEDSVAKITPPEFLLRPKYYFKGAVDNRGDIKGTYGYTSLKDDKKRTASLDCKWSQIYQSRSLKDSEKQKLKEKGPCCGGFSFELRAWDIDAEGTQEIFECFDIQKTQIRKAISTHKGISVYRDGILVLPKSDNARDWLGLDLRRVSKVGTRLSTSQIVGHVAISAEGNSTIKDTSDRERLASTNEVTEFEVILRAAVSLLENERDRDRVTPEHERPLEDLFSDLSAEELLAEVLAIAEEGGPASETVPLLQTFNKSLDTIRKTIQERFAYYSRMATVGTIAQMLIHEIRNRTTIMGALLTAVKKHYSPFSPELEDSYMAADAAIDSLESLAERFAPLASRSFRRRKRNSNLKEQLEACLSLQKGDILKHAITTKISNNTDVQLAVDPGELDAILLNLTLNAVYWLAQEEKRTRTLEIKSQSISNGERVRVFVDDSGPGISDDDLEKVLWPGVTKKPNGIGMGLTVAAELVAEYGGQLRLKNPGTLGGASVSFDLPLKKHGE
jgi:signal transduction histidine kinase